MPHNGLSTSLVSYKANGCGWCDFPWAGNATRRWRRPPRVGKSVASTVVGRASCDRADTSGSYRGCRGHLCDHCGCVRPGGGDRGAGGGASGGCAACWPGLDSGALAGGRRSGGDVVGHVVCSRGSVGDVPALALGPLSVRPDSAARERLGRASALMHARALGRQTDPRAQGRAAGRSARAPARRYTRGSGSGMAQLSTGSRQQGAAVGNMPEYLARSRAPSDGLDGAERPAREPVRNRVRSTRHPFDNIIFHV